MIPLWYCKHGEIQDCGDCAEEKYRAEGRAEERARVVAHIGKRYAETGGVIDAWCLFEEIERGEHEKGGGG